MIININIKQLGKKGRRIKPVPFEYEKCPASAEELIEETVKIMLKRFKEKQAASNEEHIPEALSDEAMNSMAEIGKIAFGYIYNDKEQDEAKAIETAELAYEDGLVRIFINGEDVEFKKEGTPIKINEGDEVTFVRLAMLAGRMW